MKKGRRVGCEVGSIDTEGDTIGEMDGEEVG